LRRDVNALVLTSVNTCWKTPITLQTLLHLLRSRGAPGPWVGHVRQFFSDVPVGAIRRFCQSNNISSETLQDYYETHILPLGDRNPELERSIFNGDMGAAL
jgi:hypothetical protein